MFPVKGLSISAEKLKIETENGAVPANAAPAPASKPARKRKRPNQQNVTAENFADLWGQVIEHKEAPKPQNNKQEPKRQKTEHQPAPKDSTNAQDKTEDNATKKGKKQKQKKSVAPAENADDDFNGFDDEEDKTPKPTPVAQDGAGKKKKNNNNKDKKQTPKVDNDADTTKETAPPPKPPAAPTPAPGPKLTPLQASMREKLISARFRHLNETLYTRPSKESFSLFTSSPEMFSEYHEGFRRQVEVWPENPVDIYISDIKTRAPLRQPPKSHPALPTSLPLPRDFNSKICTIADLGCGDAKLATTLQPLAKKSKLHIHSFDLQTGGNPLVTKADIANLPLEPGTVDVVVFCLALMGTNWTDFIEEAYRVLRWKGELWVAEIKSRFASPSTTTTAAAVGSATTTQPSRVVSHSVGNRRKQAKPTTTAKATVAAEEAADLADLAVHVDGDVPLVKSTTDISAFVSALQSRGFLLHRDMGEHAVDMSNKMFVRMSFVKAAPALVGKCSDPKALEREARFKEQREVEKKLGPNASKLGKDRGKRREQGILKPCVYKLR
ncbi:putative ribosomal RNA-processing protein 8 [Cercophora samala]|uniref:Ribosomal RNA-processing protein 8 n=1 Tax=Cercophora samala TaxID=330535 RepID=A0AA39ZHD5_9PEZI|nr:putative ribosomal RNA-processing protein 8 [Cercophora samala]